MRHHDIPLTSVEITDTFCVFYKKFHFCHLLPFAKVGQYNPLSGSMHCMCVCVWPWYWWRKAHDPYRHSNKHHGNWYEKELVPIVHVCNSARRDPDMAYRRLRARRVLMQFKDIMLRTRRVLSLYKVYGNSTLLHLNGISLYNGSKNPCKLIG